MLALPPSVAGLVSVSLATSVSCICSCNCIRIRCVEEHLRVEPTRTASVISGHWDWSCYCSGIACVCCCRLISSSPEIGPSVWATFPLFLLRLLLLPFLAWMVFNYSRANCADNGPLFAVRDFKIAICLKC